MTTRRTVLQVMSALALAPLLPLRAAAAPGFRLLCLATKWGNDDPIDVFCDKIKRAGFDGAELWVSSDPAEHTATLAAFRRHGLKLVFLIGGSDRDYAKHLAQFKAQLEIATAAEPLRINCHTGRDFFTAEQNASFFELTHQATRRTGVPISHETHRSRGLFAAPVARPFLERDPALRLTFDVSHWCVVSESLLQNQAPTLDLAISRSDHIHARVGHAQGPQVNDPRAPEWANALKAHLGWWDRIVAAKQQAGATLTVLSEFGPVPYLPALPYTQQPLADQWEINVWMMQLFRERYL